MLRRCRCSSIMAALSPAARWTAENGWLAAITRMRCWFGRITIPDEANSCVESGWASCMADVLKELGSLDRFDGPFMGPGRQRRYFDRRRHFCFFHHFGGAARVLYPPPLVVARHLLRELERASHNQRLPSSRGGDRGQKPEQIQKPVASFDIEADIISKLGQPDWWDEVGCPRYAPFKPWMTCDFYAKEVALLRIQCQSCHAKYLVCVSAGLLDKRPLQTRSQPLAYGDPPRYCCQLGASMTSETIEVVELWVREKGKWRKKVPHLYFAPDKREIARIEVDPIL